MLEQRSQEGEIDLFFADEVQVSEEGNVPYGWQFKDENISLSTAKGKKLNCFGMISRDNRFKFATTYLTIESCFVIEQINNFSYTLARHTVIVLDNAKVHWSKHMKAMQNVWAKRKLFLFYLPPYSPQINIIERVWKELKERWITTDNYQSTDTLFYHSKLILNEIGKSLTVNFKKLYPLNFE